MIVDNATLKSYFETNDYPTAQDFINLIDSLSVAKAPFKTVAGFISQFALEDPVLTISYNDTGFTWTSQRDAVGTYRLTQATGDIAVLKDFWVSQGDQVNSRIGIQYFGEPIPFRFYTLNNLGVLTDSRMSQTMFTIHIYD